MDAQRKSQKREPEIIAKDCPSHCPLNLCYAQSGGVTPVINATAAGVIETARESGSVDRVFCAKDGILGVLREDLYDMSVEDASEIALLSNTPGGAFGSCRFKLPPLDVDEAPYRRVAKVLHAHGINVFLYNGGGDSQDTSARIALAARKIGIDLQCIGLPKTVDNDLPFTDFSPGFPSVARYLNIATQEAALDVRAMSSTSTSVFILETMGRHTGWLAAATLWGKDSASDAPHLVLVPEVPFEEHLFLSQVEEIATAQGYCVVVASEGIRNSRQELLADSASKDAFGHAQLGGVAAKLASMVAGRLKRKVHWALPDYLQRSARHAASRVDVDCAYLAGQAGVEAALSGETDIMITLERHGQQFSTGTIELSQVANVEKALPSEFFRSNGCGITATTRLQRYLDPLIRRSAKVTEKKGFPCYARLKLEMAPKRLPPYPGAND